MSNYLLAYSALRFEESIPLAATQSPFNVGYSIDLREFSPAEVAELAAKKGLTLDEAQIQALMRPIGGIPSLTQLTLNSIRERGADLLDDSAAIASIYQEHLEVLELYLRQKDLYLTMNQIATTAVKIAKLDNKAKNLLYRHGLIITTSDRQVLPRCELYRRFFTEH